MSLVSMDGESEQNEIRSLQEKLESTMKLVSNLSGQLTELKEQVRLLFPRLPLETSDQAYACALNIQAASSECRWDCCFGGG